MARQGISKEQVFTAATDIHREGAVPTVQEVRKRIGSGSYTTINSHLGEWRKEHAAMTAPANIPDIPERVNDAFKQIWAMATKAAQGTVETQRQALDAMRREMDKEQAAMAAEIEELGKLLKESQDKAATLEASLAGEQSTREKAEKQVTELRIENAGIEATAKAGEERATELKEQLRELQEKFTAIITQQGLKKEVDKNQPKPHQ